MLYASYLARGTAGVSLRVHPATPPNAVEELPSGAAAEEIGNPADDMYVVWHVHALTQARAHAHTQTHRRARSRTVTTCTPS